MILSVVLGLVAGWGTRPLQPHVTEALVRLFGEARVPDQPSRRVASFGLALAAAALAATLLGQGGHALWLIGGGLLGYFQKDIREALLARRG